MLMNYQSQKQGRSIHMKFTLTELLILANQSLQLLILHFIQKKEGRIISNIETTE